MRRFLILTLTIVGLGLTVCSATKPWFEVPTGLTTDTKAALTISSALRELPAWKILLRALVILVGILMIAIPRCSVTRQPWAIISGSALLVALLLFPCMQIAMQPDEISQACWLQIQHENLTWFGGDLFRGQEFESTPSKVQLYLSDAPRQVAVMDLPTWSFGLRHIRDVIQWTGYTNTFCQFVGRGWSLAVSGITCLLIGCLFDGSRISMRYFRVAVRTFLTCAFLGGVVVCFRPLQASAAITQAATATHRGNHEKACNRLQAAGRAWPPLQEDTWFITQLGRTQHLLDLDSPFVRLHRARLSESSRQFDVADARYLRLATDPTTPKSVRREACRGILRSSIRALNSGETNGGVEGFRQVLQVEPNNIKSLYALMIAYARTGQLSRMHDAHNRLVRIYEYLNFPNRRIVLGKASAMVGQPPPFDSLSSALDDAGKNDSMVNLAN